MEHEEKIKVRTLRREEFIQKDNEVTLKNAKISQNMKTKWSATQKVKKDRQIRDLQFEMATQKNSELKKNRSNNWHNKEQSVGFDKFEVNLKRSGLGGGDDTGDGLTISYEDSQLFQNRVEEVASKNWPSNSDVGNFLTQLNERTTQKRNARQDKDRRRRRMLVEQKEAALETLRNDESDLISLTCSISSNSINSMEQSNEKRRLKELKNAELSIKAKEERIKLFEVAEENILQFANTFRESSDENSRKTAVAELTNLRLSRWAEKNKAANAFIREMVVGLIDDCLEDSDSKPSSSLSNSQSNSIISLYQTRKIGKIDSQYFSSLPQDRLKYSKDIMSLARCRLQESENIPCMNMKQVTSNDQWASFATIAANIGRWNAVSIKSTDSDNNILSVSRSPSFSESAQSIIETLLVQNSTDLLKIIKPTSEVESIKVIKDETVEDNRDESETEEEELVEDETKEQESIVPLSESKDDADNDNILALSEEEQKNLSSIISDSILSENSIMHRIKVLVIQNSGGIGTSVISKSVLMRVSKWCGDLCVPDVWDAAASMESALQLQPLVEGKVPTLNFSNLVDIFISNSIKSDGEIIENNYSCPSELSSTPISAQAMRIIGEMVETTLRIMSTKDAVHNGTLNASSCPFTHTSLAILIGQSLWIRNFIRSQFQKLSLSCPIRPICIVVSSVNNQTVNLRTDNGSVFSSTIDWFYRGGTKENIPAEGEPNIALKQAIISEVGDNSKPEGKKAASKSKEPDVLYPQCSISAIIWLRTSNNGDLKDFSKGENVIYSIIASYSESFYKDSPPLDNSIDELEMIKYVEFCHSQQTDDKLLVYGLESASNNNETANGFPLTLKYAGELSVSEVFISILLDMTGVYQVQFENSPQYLIPIEEDNIGNKIKQTCARAEFIVNLRRNQLPPGFKLWFLHKLETNPLDMMMAYQSHSELCSSRSSEIELRGLLIMSLGFHISHIERQIKFREAALVEILKSTDIRWQEYCMNLQNILANYPNQDSKLLVSDLICRLGDIIDDRHMLSLNKIKSYEKDSILELNALYMSIMEMMTFIGETMFQTLESTKQAALSLSTLVENGRYQEFPWPINTSDSNLLENKRSELTSLVSTIVNSINQIVDINTGITVPLIDPTDSVEAVWKSFSSVELPTVTSMGQLKSVALNNVYLEYIDISSSWLISIQNSIIDIKDRYLLSQDKMKKFVYDRHAFEHKTLSLWSNELKSSESYSHFLSQYYFGVSDDTKRDFIPWLSGTCFVDLNDMVMPLQSLFVFAKELSVFISGILNTTQNDENPINANEVISNSIIESVKNMVKNDVFVPKTWTEVDGVNTIVNKYLVYGNNLDIQKASSSFFRSLMMSMLLAIIPNSPSLEYINRLASIVTRTDQSFLSSEDIVGKLMSDVKISGGWWDGSSTSSKNVEMALSIILFSCINKDGGVAVEDFLFTLCKNTRLIESNIFEKSIILSSDSRNMNINNDDLYALLPAYVSEGSFKAAGIAARYSQPRSSSDSIKVVNERTTDIISIDPSKDSMNFNNLCGKSMVRTQFDWFIEQTSNMELSSNKYINEEIWSSLLRVDLGVAKCNNNLENGELKKVEIPCIVDINSDSKCFITDIYNIKDFCIPMLSNTSDLILNPNPLT
jgi:hypothetical protein